jgi:hypothetical protein
MGLMDQDVLVQLALSTIVVSVPRAVLGAGDVMLVGVWSARTVVLPLQHACPAAPNALVAQTQFAKLARKREPMLRNVFARTVSSIMASVSNAKNALPNARDAKPANLTAQAARH